MQKMPTVISCASLRGAKYIALTTYRQSGAPVSTPVWFAEDNGMLYVVTFPSAGKLKRIRDTPHVTVAPSDIRGNPRGPAIPAIAHILPPVDSPIAKRALNRKYGLVKRLYDASMRMLRLFQGKTAPGQHVYLALSPYGEAHDSMG
jgi:uncharacterized protein